MAFSDGFSSGLQLGNSIKRNKLDNEMLTLRKQQAADDIELQKQLAAQRAQQVAEDVALRRDDLTLRRDDLGFRRENAAADNARADAQLSANRMNAITGQLGSALAQARQNRLVDAQVAAMRAKTSGLTGPGGDMTTTTEDLDPETGEVMGMRRVTRARGVQPAPAQPPRPPTDPTATAAKARIGELEQQIAQDRLAQAQGDNRYGFLNINSRQGRIDDAAAEIGRLNPLTGGAGQTQQPAALTVQDQQALAWAKANPNDPRAATIVKRLSASK